MADLIKIIEQRAVLDFRDAVNVRGREKTPIRIIAGGKVLLNATVGPNRELVGRVIVAGQLQRIRGDRVVPSNVLNELRGQPPASHDHELGDLPPNIALFKDIRAPVEARLTWVSVSSITIGAAGVTSSIRDSTNQFTIAFSTALTVDPSAGVGAGGLDAGTEAASIWYAVYLIADSTGANPVAGILSTNGSDPVLPAGYDIFARVGWVRNNAASDLVDFRQHGRGRDRTYFWVTDEALRFVLVAGAAAAYASVSAATLVPPLTNAQAYFKWDNDGTKDARISSILGGPDTMTLKAKAIFISWLTLHGAQLFDYGFTLTAGASLNAVVLGWKETI
jgi:hypothetical protein